MDFSLNRDKKNTAEMLPFNLLIKIANATLYKVDLDPEGLQSSQVKCTPNIPWMNLLFKSWIGWYRCSCKFQIHLCIPACVMSREFTRKAVIKFLQAYFPEFDVNVFKAMLFILRFSIWPNTEKSSQNIHCSWCMQECRFELDISYRN